MGTICKTLIIIFIIKQIVVKIILIQIQRRVVFQTVPTSPTTPFNAAYIGALLFLAVAHIKDAGKHC